MRDSLGIAQGHPAEVHGSSTLQRSDYAHFPAVHCVRPILGVRRLRLRYFRLGAGEDEATVVSVHLWTIFRAALHNLCSLRR